jgi:hypothetical protein
MRSPKSPGSIRTREVWPRGAAVPRLVFATSHTRVLLAVAQDPEVRIEEIANAAGIAVRSAYRILAELVEAGYLRRTRVGRRNHYELNRDLPLGDSIVGEHTLSELLSFIGNHPPASLRGPAAE